MKRTIALVFPALVLALAACTSTAATPSPSATAAPVATPSASPSAAAARDIVGTATAAGSFKTLLTAATAAGLVDTLQGKGPFTVFAPCRAKVTCTVFAPPDEAFAALPAGTLDKLLADKEALKQVLLYHVVAGDVTADQGVKLTSATSVEGAPIAISVKDGKVYLNGSAQVVTPDVMASNGVIHVIDK